MLKTGLIFLILILIKTSVSLAGTEVFVRPSFNDQDLQTILKQSETDGSAGVFYTWSPRMNLSVVGVEELASITKKLNLKLTVLVDPSAIESEIISSSAKNILLLKSSRLDSSILIGMSMKIHFPSLVLYKNGQILTPSRPGYDEPERVEKYLLRRLQ